MRFLYRKMATPRLVLLALLPIVTRSVAFAVWGNATVPAGAPDVLALQLAFSEEAFDSILQQWSTAGVHYCRASTLVIDKVLPVV